MLFVQGYASIHKLEMSKNGKAINCCLRVPRKLENEFNEDGSQAYEVQFFNAVILGEAVNGIGKPGIVNKDFVKINKGRVVNETYVDNNGQKFYNTKILIFELEKHENSNQKSQNTNKNTNKRIFD